MQLRIEVSDGGLPPCSRTTVAKIDVRRNLNAPRFTRSEWTVNIMETHSLTEAFVTVEARDADDKDPHKTIRYEIESNSQYRDRFTLDPVTGQLFLRRTLVGETTNQYTVGLTCVSVTQFNLMCLYNNAKNRKTLFIFGQNESQRLFTLPLLL